VPWPGAAVNILEVGSFFTVNPKALSVQCVVGQEAAVSYLLQALAPLILATVMVLLYMGSTVLHAAVSTISAWEFNKALNSLGQVYTVIFIILATTVSVPFVCYSHPNGEASVIRYPWVLCGSSDQSPLVIISILQLVLFLLPYISLCVYSNQQVVKIQGQHAGVRGLAGLVLGRSPTDVQTRFRFLMYRFRPDRWWWGNVFMTRQVLLAFSPLVPANDPHAQALAVCIILVVYAVYAGSYWPWKANVLNMLDITHCVVLAFFVVCGTAFMDKSESTEGYSVIMIVCFTTVISSVFIVGGKALFLIAKHGRSHDFSFGAATTTVPAGLAKSWKQVIDIASGLTEQETGVLMVLMNQYDWSTLQGAVGIWKALAPQNFPGSGAGGEGTSSSRIEGLSHSAGAQQSIEQQEAIRSLSRLSQANRGEEKKAEAGDAKDSLQLSEASSKLVAADVDAEDPAGFSLKDAAPREALEAALARATAAEERAVFLEGDVASIRETMQQMQLASQKISEATKVMKFYEP